MKLNYIGLMFDPDDLNASREFKSDFGFKNRFIGNYLTRKLKEERLTSEGFNKIALIAKIPPLKQNEVFEGFLRVEIPFDKSKYENQEKEGFREFFLQLYKEGIAKAAKTHEVHEDFLLNNLEHFRSNNYLNEWEYKSKLFVNIGIRARLICNISPNEFSLRIILTKKKEVVFSKKILSTLPDEIIYHWQFKEIVLEGSEIKVLDEFQHPIYSLDINAQSLNHLGL